MEASNGAGELSNISMNSTTAKPIAVGAISLKPVPVILRPGLSPRSVVLIRPAMHGLTRLNPPKTTPTSTVSGPRIVGYTSCPRKPMQSLNKLSSVPSIVKVENPSNIRIIKEENTTALVSALRNSPISLQMNNPHDSANPSTNNTAMSPRLPAIEANKSSHQSAPIHREVTREMQVDYITNSSSDEEKLSADERELIYQETGVDEEEGLKALLTDNGESDVVPDESVRTRINEEEVESASEEETSDNQKHRLSSREHSHRRDRSGASRSSKKRRTHARGESGSMDSSSSSSSPSSSDASSSSSDDSSDSDMAPDDPIKISRKAEKKVEMMRKISDKVSAHVASPKLPNPALLESTFKRPSSEELGSSPSAKRPKPEESSVSGPTSTSVLPVSDDALTAAVRKYLMRKPITVTDLWKKIRVKKLVPKTDDAQTLLANSLRQLKPIKQIINGQHVLSLKR